MEVFSARFEPQGKCRVEFNEQRCLRVERRTKGKKKLKGGGGLKKKRM